MRRRTNNVRHIVALNPLRAVALAAFALALVAPPAGGQETMTDQGIVDAVENEILFDLSTPLNKIDVSVTDGIVELTGTVNNLLAKDRAGKLAETVKGVRSVSNRIEVRPYWGRMDWQIENDAEEALVYDSATDSWEIDVEVTDNKATLTGTVDSWQEKQLAAKIVKGVRGVAAIDNRIEIDFDTDRPDMEIASEIEEALRWDRYVDDGLIDVKVNNGKVKLSGTVGSAAERRQAATTAWVAGVRSVDESGLKVERWARDPELRKDKYKNVTDAKVEQAVEAAMLYDPRVLSFNVTPDVSNGMVTLRGQVDNLKAKRAAADIARRTVGVFSVRNRIRVRPRTPTDERIEENIEQALLRDPHVERSEISVIVVDKEAFLYGTVDSYFEKSQADDIASRAYGVTEVINNLDVDNPTPLGYDPYLDDIYPYDSDWYDYEPGYTFQTDAEIERDIESEIFWSPFVNSSEVKVEVDNGTATLTGTVDTWSEREAATENAYEGGATWVDNELEVR